MTYDSREACKDRLTQFFANKDESFYQSDIMKLSSKWQEVIEKKVNDSPKSDNFKHVK